jgi:hypothetical protein
MPQLLGMSGLIPVAGTAAAHECSSSWNGVAPGLEQEG